MKQWRRLIFYLALNFIVSACAMLAVLLIWDQINSPAPRGVFTSVLSRWAGAEATTQATPGATETAAPKATPTEAFFIHEVQAGETFESIAKLYGVSVGELLAANGYTKVEPLSASELLLIPDYPDNGVYIESVIGYGDLESEHVRIKHNGEGEISLVGWRLEQASGQVYVFSQASDLTLYGGGAVSVYSKAGQDNVVELFWGLDAPVWHSGATVVLRNAQGTVVDTYVIP